MFDGTQSCASVDPELFFPVSKEDLAINLGIAQAICAACPMFKVCDEYATSNPELQGIWAGKYRISRGFRTARFSNERTTYVLTEKGQRLLSQRAQS